MSTLVSRLANNGTYYANSNANVIFDEVTKSVSSVDVTAIYASELDEVTYANSADFARRISNTGVTYVSGIFDEQTGIS